MTKIISFPRVVVGKVAYPSELSMYTKPNYFKFWKRKHERSNKLRSDATPELVALQIIIKFGPGFAKQLKELL